MAGRGRGRNQTEGHLSARVTGRTWRIYMEDSEQNKLSVYVSTDKHFNIFVHSTNQSNGIMYDDRQSPSTEIVTQFEPPLRT